MNKKLKILHLEDTFSDAELVYRALKKGELNFERLVVDTKVKFIRALKEFLPDIILSDHSLPSFNSYEALIIFQQTELKVPFILITATISEDFAVDILKRGADDYILKDRLDRLPAALQNALDKYQLVKDHQENLDELIKNEMRYRALIENSHDAITLINESGEWEYQSPAVERLTGFTFKELSGKKAIDYIHEDDLASFIQYFEEVKRKPGIPIRNQFRLLHKSGHYIYAEGTVTNLLNDESVKAFIMNYQDCTYRNQADAEKAAILKDLLQRNNDLEQFSYIVSHNLRSPVANMMGLADALNQDKLTKWEMKEVSKYLVQSTRQLDTVIKDLNHVLRVKQKINENKEVVVFSELISEISTSIQNLIDDENVQIKSDFSGGDELWTLRSYIYSIFFNLISNSLKYRQANLSPFIEIKSETFEHGLVITFKDNGIGLDLVKNEDQLFGLYKRFHHHVEGKGMGLFMVKTQLDTLGGKISVKSEVNSGTEFKIEFKL